MDDGVDASDTPAEVDATFRTLRRVAVGYFVVFLLAVAAFPVLSLTLDWWSRSRLVGGMSPGFLVAAFGLYVFFTVLGVAAASLSSAVEHRMLGTRADDDPFGDAVADASFDDGRVGGDPFAGPHPTDTFRLDDGPGPGGRA
ncbi:hypothetical protein [Isoptericola aurantiacus]|uniref:hypothetical protein n=1 Tax=Isoptericola aurantiacus TaxID=3377839 RepID=UPI00383B3B40